MIHHFDTLDSTNTKAKAMAQAGAPHGTVVVADHQTGGRGRLGRSFDSPAGGIYMSMILRPNCPPTQLMHLTCAVAVAVCNGVEQALGFRPQIKWINDLVVNGKKLAGILSELSIDPKTGLVDFGIVGIGINCNRREEDFPPELRTIACSASMITGHPIDKNALLDEIIGTLRSMGLSNKADILQQYRRDCITLGKEVIIHRGTSQLQGTAMDVTLDGALIVNFPDGRTETIDCGEVSVRGLYGYA